MKCTLNRLAPFALAALLLPACHDGGGSGGSGSTPAPPPGLSVLSRSPAPGAANVARTRVILLGLSMPADPATVNGANVTLEAGGGPVAAIISYLACHDAIQIEATAPLAASTVHQVSVGAGVATTMGMPIAPDTFTFTTGASGDVQRPVFGGIATAAGASTTSVALSWAAANDDTTPAGGIVYDVFVSSDPACFDFATPVLSTAAGAAGATVSGLPVNSTRHFVVRARDASGNASQNSAASSAKTFVSFSQNIYAPIIGPRCALCHGPGQPGAFMQLPNAAATAAAWVNVPASGPFCFASGLDRVEPGQPLQSVVYRKVAPNDPGNPRCGSRMPDGGPFLTAAEVQLFFDWIAEGAGNN